MQAILDSKIVPCKHQFFSNFLSFFSPFFLFNHKFKKRKFGDICGQLGRGKDAKSLSPGKITFPEGGGEFLAAACGLAHSLVLMESGLYGFGLNREHQVSSDLEEAIGIPVSIPVLERVRNVACGTHHSLAVCTTGNVFAWGWNEKGQCLGKVGKDDHVVTKPTLVVMKDSEHRHFIDVAGGTLHSLALASDGTILSWGSNSLGQLGRKELQRTWVIDSEECFTQISCSNFSSSAVSDCGHLFVWGILQDVGGPGYQSVPRRIEVTDAVVLGVSMGPFHQTLKLAEMSELASFRDLCTKPLAEVAGVVQHLGQKVPSGFSEYQHQMHRFIRAKKLGAAVRVSPAVLMWTGSSETTFNVVVRSLGNKPMYCEASFLPASGAGNNKLSVEIEGVVGVLFGKGPLTVTVRCRYNAVVAPVVLMLGAVILSFTLEKDKKTKKVPSSSFVVLLTRTPPDVKSKSFMSLPLSFGGSGSLPPALFVLENSGIPISSVASASTASSPSNSGQVTPVSARSTTGSGVLPSVSARKDSQGVVNSSLESMPIVNPLLGLVHAGKRELTRKCSLDASLPYPRLIEALIKYPDREDDLMAFVNTIPMWSSAKEVLSFILENPTCAKHKKKAKLFLGLLCRCMPWTEVDEVRELGQRIQSVFGTSCVLEATEGNTLLRLLRQVWPAPTTRVMDRKSILKVIDDAKMQGASTLLESFIIEGLVVERGDDLLLPKRVRYLWLEDELNAIPINREYVAFAQSFSTGFDSVEMSEVQLGEASNTKVRAFDASEVIRFAGSQVPVTSVLAVLQSLVDCGVLAVATSNPRSLPVASDSKLFFTKFGIKVQMLSGSTLR